MLSWMTTEAATAGMATEASRSVAMPADTRQQTSRKMAAKHCSRLHEDVWAPWCLDVKGSVREGTVVVLGQGNYACSQLGTCEFNQLMDLLLKRLGIAGATRFQLPQQIGEVCYGFRSVPADGLRGAAREGKWLTQPRTNTNLTA